MRVWLEARPDARPDVRCEDIESAATTPVVSRELAEVLCDCRWVGVAFLIAAPTAPCDSTCARVVGTVSDPALAVAYDGDRARVGETV